MYLLWMQVDNTQLAARLIGLWVWLRPGGQCYVLSCDVFCDGPISRPGVKKVNCTLVQAMRLFTDRTAHRGNRGIALPFHDHGTRRGWGVSVTSRSTLPPGKTRHPLFRMLGGLLGRSEQVLKISPPTGIRSPDRPARSQSLHRLRYPAHPRPNYVCVCVCLSVSVIRCYNNPLYLQWEGRRGKESKK
jgi:hypothetical protein